MDTAKILAKSSDPEGTPRSITAYDSISAQGGTVELLSGSIRYTPPASYLGADSFGLSITDGNSTIAGAVSVTVTAPSSGSGQSFVASGLSGSDVNLKFAGIPGRNYQIQHTTSLPPTASWTPLATVTANSSGFVIYTHISPPSPSYWRTQLVP